MHFNDRTVTEAASWRLASELMRRHPTDARLFRGHPGGGQYDLLWIRGFENSQLDIRLNRPGTIQVWGRADNQRPIEWGPTEWTDYLKSEPRAFVELLERVAGWPAPPKVPRSTPTTLTYRVLAALTSFGLKTIRPIIVEQGFIDSSGDYGSGHNHLMNRFEFPSHLFEPRKDDLFGQPGYRFWIPTREGAPLCAIEQTSATAWFPESKQSVDLMTSYQRNHKEVVLVASEILHTAVNNY